MKNFKQIVKTALVGAMVIAVLASSLLISADPGWTTGGQPAPGEPAKGKLSKTLEVTPGVDVPALTFSYSFAGVSVDSDTTKTPPTLNSSTAFAATLETATTPGVGASAGFNVVAKDTTDFLASVTWPHAGAYVYNVTEVQSVPESLAANRSIAYSQAAYEMTVHVANKLPLENPNVLYVKEIEYKIIKNNDGSTTGAGDKADPVFVNRYNVTTDLKISKTVAGTYGDLTRAFDFSLTLNKSISETSATPTYTGKIYNISDPATSIGTDVTVSFASGDTSKTVTGIKLKHNEYILFTGLPTGTTYSVTENLVDASRPGEKDYIAEADVTVNGAGTAISYAGTGTAGDSLTVPATNLGEDDNIAAFTNTHQAPSITGVLVDNLPYIMLILLATVSFVAYIAFKRRKATR